MRNREIQDIAEVSNERVARSRLKENAKEEVEEKEYESGYSEAQQALDIEMRSGDLSSLKRSKAFHNLTVNTKRLVTYKTVTTKLRDLLVIYTGLMRENPHRAQKLLTEILSLRIIENYLFNAIVGKIDEKLDTTQVSEELRVFLV